MRVEKTVFHLPEIHWKKATIAACRAAFSAICLVATSFYRAACWSCRQIKAWYLDFQAQKRLGRYEFMPCNDIGFLKTAVDNFRGDLSSNERVEFDQQFKDQDADVYPKIGIAAARAFVFSSHSPLPGSFFLALFAKQKKLQQELLQARLAFLKLDSQGQQKYLDLANTTEINETQKTIYRPILTAGSILIQSKDFLNALKHVT